MKKYTLKVIKQPNKPYFIMLFRSHMSLAFLNYITFFALLVGVVLSFSSCDKEENELTTNNTTTYKLTVGPPENGTVTKDPDKSDYNQGETVTLTAKPANGYEFISWVGLDIPSGKTNANPLTLTMDAAKTLTAIFAKKTYALTLTATNGTVTKDPNKANYIHGDIVTLTLNPSAGYALQKMDGRCGGCGHS